jgi:hypothetical protein
MPRFILFVVGAAALTACGQSNDTSPTNQTAVAQPKKKPAYCFFKDDELKGWTAKRGKDGNITVTGKAHVKDPRYKPMLNPATVSGTSAEITPTIGQNDTGYGAQDDTWGVSVTIPNSAAVTTVMVTCGDKTAATLTVPAKS